MSHTRIAGRHYRTGRPVEIQIRDGWIAGLAELERPGDDLPWLAPGLVDLQVNGFAGLDFNAPEPADDLAGRVARRLWREGVASFLPAVITGPDAAIGAALEAIRRSCERDAAAVAGVAGIHLEGPFISPEDGPRGAHPRAYVRPPDWGVFQRWQERAGGRIRIVTLSPEWPGAPEFIERCVASGVVAAIGHTAATPEQIRFAVAAGARLSTHFGNGAHALLPRHPNYLWEQLADDQLWASLIADGFHLPDAVLKVVMRVKGERALLVSDSVALAGSPPGSYTAPVGGRVVLTPSGRLHLAENPALLAGAALSLAAGVGHIVRRGLAGLADAWDMASTRPAALLGMAEAAGLAAGAPASLVCFGWDGEQISVRQVYLRGQLIEAGQATIDHR